MSNAVENLIVSGNGCNLKAVIKKEEEFPCIEVWTCDENGELLEIVSLTEINTVDNNIAAFSFVEGKEEFKSKTIFK